MLIFCSLRCRLFVSTDLQIRENYSNTMISTSEVVFFSFSSLYIELCVLLFAKKEVIYLSQSCTVWLYMWSQLLNNKVLYFVNLARRRAVVILLCRRKIFLLLANLVYPSYFVMCSWICQPVFLTCHEIPTCRFLFSWNCFSSPHFLFIDTLDKLILFLFTFFIFSLRVEGKNINILWGLLLPVRSCNVEFYA